MSAPDYNTICAVEARLHEMARDLRMSFDELMEAIQHVHAYRDLAERQQANDLTAKSALNKLLGHTSEPLTEEEIEYLRAQPQL